MEKAPRLCIRGMMFIYFLVIFMKCLKKQLPLLIISKVGFGASRKVARVPPPVLALSLAEATGWDCWFHYEI